MGASMSDFEVEKASARKAGFARRKAAHADAPLSACGYLSAVLAGHRGVALAGYMPIQTEIDPLPAMAEAAAHGPIGVPVIQKTGLGLLFSQWTPDCVLKNGPFGAQVPEHERFFEPEILIVPLVAFDLCGGRLGYGGGFYDRTLQALRARRATLAIGFAYAAQQTEHLPLEATDQPLNFIVTERGVIEI
jgi:5-formyltetrahydrofolate cyclo-ligase